MKSPKDQVPKRLKETDWHHDDDLPPAIGCASCFVNKVCGGIQVSGGAIDCQRFCCGTPSTCTTVCFNSPAVFARRVREVRGFDLSNVPRAAPVAVPPLNGYAPLVHHAFARIARLPQRQVSLSLFELIDRHGNLKYPTQEEVGQKFGIRDDATIVVSSINKDALLERIWSSSNRASLCNGLARLGIAAITVPNFSTYTNVPRTENLYNIKRICLLTAEFLAAGLPTALHINALNPTDYKRYTEFICERPEVQAISVDFITGAKANARLAWHAKQLVELALSVGRPIQLFIRGGRTALPVLKEGFRDILLIDSQPLQQALHRRQLVLGNDGILRPVTHFLPHKEPVDALFWLNVRAAARATEQSRNGNRISKETAIELTASSRSANRTDDQPLQLNLFPKPRTDQRRRSADNAQGVIATAKPKVGGEVGQPLEKRSKPPPMS